MIDSVLVQSLKHLRVVVGRVVQHLGKNRGLVCTLTLESIAPGRDCQGVLPTEPGFAFLEWQLVGTRFEEAGTTKITDHVCYRLAQSDASKRPQEIELPIERRPFQSSIGQRHCFREPMATVR